MDWNKIFPNSWSKSSIKFDDFSNSLLLTKPIYALEIKNFFLNESIAQNVTNATGWPWQALLALGQRLAWSYSQLKLDIKLNINIISNGFTIENNICSTTWNVTQPTAVTRFMNTAKGCFLSFNRKIIDSSRYIQPLFNRIHMQLLL